MSTVPVLPVPAQRWLRRNWLSSVMLIAYLLFSMLILEQGRIIEAQRTLIRQLFADSQQLTKLKVERMREQREH
ncbi:MAG TPA: hypothetical protein VLA96_13795 [Terriglobales bacterium]|jgi:hypothetical protein|nr:hypothetical protein [Terriglobales bacterium]